MKDTCIIGYGVVGRATASVFGIDKYVDLKDSTITLEEAAKCKYIFLCLPTPVKEGKYDITAITETIQKLKECNCSGILINRSTVLPGTNRELQEKFELPIVANPEFLTEKTAEYDAKHPDFVVIGADESGYGKDIKAVYEARFKGVTIIETDTITAEAIKIVLNSFFAMKVVFANEIHEMCQKQGINYGQVKEAIEKHKFGSKNHFDIWHNGGRGAGGK
mgnify:CR=1 FL=1